MTRISKVALLGLAGVMLSLGSITLHANDVQLLYLHALTELRTARALLQNVDGASRPDDEEILAAREIDDAIAGIHGVYLDDGKAADDRLSIDSHLSRKNRLRKALDQLEQAKQNCEKEEAQNVSGTNTQIVQQIEQARKRVSAVSNLVDLSSYRCAPDLPCVADFHRSK